jgi:hypothetical protein
VGEQYAIDANIEFFTACRSVLGYISWLRTRAGKLDGSKLFEINDLLPKWDQTMHRKLIEMEKKKFPGLIKLLVDKLHELIAGNASDVVVADIGSGGMEAERQVLGRLIAGDHSHKVVFVGVDQSLDARVVAKENLASLGDDIVQVEVDQLTAAKLGEIISKESKRFIVIHCRNDIFALDKVFGSHTFNIAFHTLFKHHLTTEQQDHLDQILDKIATRVLEYDGFQKWFLLVPQSIFGWVDPVFLNATVFSFLRYKKVVATSKKILISGQTGHYLLSR